jgi:hypothetical protein
MSTRMAGHHRRHVCYLAPRLHGAPAEIHVLEPHRIKLLVEAAQLFPDIAADHQESPGRLFYLALLI